MEGARLEAGWAPRVASTESVPRGECGERAGRELGVGRRRVLLGGTAGAGGWLGAVQPVGRLLAAGGAFKSRRRPGAAERRGAEPPGGPSHAPAEHVPALPAGAHRRVRPGAARRPGPPGRAGRPRRGQER